MFRICKYELGNTTCQSALVEVRGQLFGVSLHPLWDQRIELRSSDLHSKLF